VGLSETELVRWLLSERARLLAYIWAIVRDNHLTEDIFQEVSLLAVDKRSEIRNSAALPVWLRKAARFHALAAIRRDRKNPAVLSNEVLDALDRSWASRDQASAAATVEALQQCLAELAPKSRELVALRYQDRLSGDEVAGRLGVKVHSVYVALGRVHRALRDCIQRRLSSKGDARG
jgi:RNA polymerase sigma-70 factor, ECF subfamily